MQKEEIIEATLNIIMRKIGIELINVAFWMLGHRHY